MTEYKKPGINLLTKAMPINATVTDEHKKRAETLQAALNAYNLPGQIVGIRPGPMVTTYEFKPEISVRMDDLLDASVDIARAVSASQVRIAHIPHTDLFGIEIDNSSRQTIRIGDLVAGTEFANPDRHIPLALGVRPDGTPAYFDLTKLPHLLISGRTGTGKSVFVQSIIMSLVYRFTPDECKLMIIDPKGVDFGFWDDIPHLITPVIKLDADASLNALKWVLREIDRRYELLQTAEARNIETYNESAETRMPYLVVVIDEFADLMAIAPHETEASVQRIAMKARAAGIHLILATQRPDTDVITDVIKSYLPSRVAFRARDTKDSEMMLGESGAEHLLSYGDMMFSDAGRVPVRIHPAFIDDNELTAVADHLRKQGAPKYIDGITDAPSDADETNMDELYARAVEYVTRDNKPTISYLQRCLMIGYNRAATLIEWMERDGIVSTPDRDGKRYPIRE